MACVYTNELTFPIISKRERKLMAEWLTDLFKTSILTKEKKTSGWKKTICCGRGSTNVTTFKVFSLFLFFIIGKILWYQGSTDISGN